MTLGMRTLLGSPEEEAARLKSPRSLLADVSALCAPLVYFVFLRCGFVACAATRRHLQHVFYTRADSAGCVWDCENKNKNRLVDCNFLFSFLSLSHLAYGESSFNKINKLIKI